MTPPEAATRAIVAAGRRLDARGWVPATAGNISVRLDGERAAITSSGVHKGFLEPAHIMVVDFDGQALTPGLRPSAETLLHTQLYRRFPDVGAVLHGHSVANTVLTMTHHGDFRFAGYELLKIFEGQATHDVALDLPVVDNDQDMRRLSAVLEPILARGAPMGYLIRGHGAYVWGPTMDAALARMESLEFLLACELERRR